MNTCDKCPYSIENVEEQYDRIGVWYECILVDGGCNPGERLKNCPFREEQENEEEEFGWCKGCKEYDNENHCCHRYSSFIRESLQENINAVLEEIKKTLQEIADDVGEDKGLECAIEVIEDYIENHKGEIEERPTAKWLFDEHIDENMYCSNCGFYMLSDYVKGFRYCPKCGAKMKGNME